MSRRSLDGDSILEENSGEEDQKTNVKNLTPSSKSTTSANKKRTTSPLQIAKNKAASKQVATSVNLKPGAKDDTTKENRSTTPIKKTTTASGSKSPPKNFNTLAGESKKLKKIKGLGKFILGIMNYKYNSEYRMGRYFYKWRQICSNIELHNVIKEFQDIEFDLHERAERESAFREKVRTIKTDIDNKVHTLGQFITMNNNNK